MRRPIGYYVHHHGAGHLTRAMTIADAMGERVTLLGTGLVDRTGNHRCVDLPDDRIEDNFDGADRAGGRPAALHYAPLDHNGIRCRVAAFTDWVATAKPALLVVDVSCEIAMLARLASVPTVYVRLGGDRNDEPHRQAFASAEALLAPFAEPLEVSTTPEWVRQKTGYFSGLVGRPPHISVDAASVVVVIGAGGDPSDGAIWARAAVSTPERNWTVIGPCSAPAVKLANLTLAGWVDDASTRIAAAGVVVGSGGNGVIGATLAARRPFVCMPEDRPYGEQRWNADRLEAAGAAIVCDDPLRADWGDLLARAEQLSPDAAAALDDPAGPARAAAWLSDIADRQVA